MHALVRRVFGSYALCGAGRIHLPLGGRLHPEEYAVCADCAAIVKAQANAEK
jgi:hypothetical protein